MAINCQEIVNWLKTWFTPRNEDYNYDLSVSDYNPVIDSTVTIGVNVTDGNGEIVNNHSFKLWINDDSYETLTTNNDGYASYTFTCSDWGIVRFTAETKNTTVIRVTGWRIIEHTNYNLFINGAERLCEIRYYKPGTSIGTSWTFVETISDSDYVPAPQQDSVYCPCNTRGMVVRIFSSGSIQAQATTATSNQLFSFHAMWHY